MKFIGRRQSSNVEDRRRMPGGKKTIFGGGIIGIIVVVIAYFMNGGDALQVLQDIQQQNTSSYESQAVEIDPAEDEMANYISVALADNEDVWNKIFAESSLEYKEPMLVLYKEGTESGCGNASSAIGPFYCPADEKIYVDLSFFNELVTRFGADRGDFSIAYVLAHEVGHHVQNLLGTSQKMMRAQQGLSQEETNKYSVALELQADFYAGIWAYYTQKYKNVLEEGDIEEAMSAASAVGDDKIQKRSQGYIVPDAFTHGTSQQRMYWFKKGYNSGDVEQGDTFSQLGLTL